jgi:pilus assembly protein Flp/PilA
MLSLWEKAQVKTWEVGQGLVEYALILVLVAVVVIVILTLLGPAIGNVFQTIVDAINGV